MSDQIKVDLDPRKVIEALTQMSEEAKRLSKDIEDSLGKEGPKNINKLEDAAEKGTNKISSFFRNLGQRVKEDLKTAFDATGMMAGTKMLKELGSGVQQVFEMERAFDRLNTRLGLSTKEMEKFKKSVGQKVAGTGQKLEDVLPGVEIAASRGGVKSPEQLADISEALGRAKATTGESTDALSEGIIAILRDQNIKVTGSSFKAALDAVQGTRVAGAFKNADDAAKAMHAISGNLSPEQLKKMGLDTRSLGGLAAASSKSGEGGVDIMSHILQMASKAGGKDLLNTIFGTQLFKGGKLDSKALANINPNALGQFSEQTLADATGASQADLAKWITAMKSSQADFSKVVQGTNETADQFAVATDNLASKFDQFKEGVKEAGREVGESLSHFVGDLMKGNFKNLRKDAVEVVGSGLDNAGHLAGAGAMTIGAGLLMGGGLNKLLKKVPGGGLAGSLVGGEVAKAAGATPVFVVNAADIGGGGAGAAADAAAAAAKVGKVGGGLATAGKFLGGALAVGAAYEIGTIIGDAINDRFGSKIDSWLGLDKRDESKEKAAMDQGEKQAIDSMYKQRGGNYRGQHYATPEAFAKAVKDAMMEVDKAKNEKIQYTNPSSVHGRGGQM